MSLVLVDFKDLEKIRRLNSLGSGKEGRIYEQLDTKQLIKLYHSLDGKRKVYFDDLVCSNISFPKEILMFSNYVAGYTMDYLGGEKIRNGFSKDLEIQTLKKMYLEIYKIIQNYPDIYMDDVCLANILVDNLNERINLIDTSRWYLKTNSSKENLLWLDRCLIYALCQQTLDWENDNQEKSSELVKLYCLYKLGKPVSFLEILEAVWFEIEEKSGVKVKTLGGLTLLR